MWYNFSMIKFENVSIQYIKDFFNLLNFTLNINSNTLFVGDFFNGTNSIMRTLARIDKHYTGDIFIDDVNLKNIKDKDLDIVYLPENPVLFKNKNIFKNLYFPLKIRKINKNSAKNLIYSTFLELKNNNINFFDNYFQIKNLNNHAFINTILKLKINKLNFGEQKIITLIRALLRKPKYVLLENFFEELNEEYIPLVKYLLNKLKESSTIIACEKSLNLNFEDFRIINLTNKKKED